MTVKQEPQEIESVLNILYSRNGIVIQMKV